MVALYEKLRPQTLDEFVGFSEQVQQLEGMREIPGWAGQAFWITGPSGYGKSTLARIIANEVSEPWAVEEIDAQEMSLDFVRDFERKCAYQPMTGEAHVCICNEAHNLNHKTVSRLQTFLEHDHVQRNATVIFTTTDHGQQKLWDTRFDAFPFLSRCIMVELTVNEATMVAFRDYLMKTADRLGLNGKPPIEYENLLVRCQGNLRMALQEIAAGKMKAR